MNALLEAALARAREGAYVIPLWWTDAEGVCACDRANCSSPGKHPLTAQGLDDGSRNISTIQAWWRQWPEANVGVRTDDVPRIDIDLVQAAEALLEDPELPFVTEVVRTPRGGLHIALGCPGARTAKLRLEDGRTLGDFKAGRAYVLVPPSRVGGRAYELLSPDFVEPLAVADPMSWLQERLSERGLSLGETYDAPAYRNLTAKVPEGDRHPAITSHAGLLWVEGIAPAAFGAAIHAINEAICEPPLPADEVEAIIAHFVDRGEPRRVAALLSAPTRAAVSASIQSLDEWLDGEDPPLDVVLGDGKDGAILPIDGKGFVAGSTASARRTSCCG